MLYEVITEKGEGEPVILIHGFFFDTYLWADNIDALAQKFKLYLIDLWGCGYSSRTPMAYCYPLYSDQIVYRMRAIDSPPNALFRLLRNNFV